MKNKFVFPAGRIIISRGKAYIDQPLLDIKDKWRIPGIRWANKRGQWYVYMSKSVAEILGEMYDIDLGWEPTPIDINKIVYKTKPYDHQSKGVALGMDKKYFAYLMEQGTGKSKVVIDSVMTLHRDEHLTHVMIICPKTVMGSWEEQIIEHAHCNNWNLQRWGSKSPTLKSNVKGISALIINIDAINTPRGYKFAYDWILNSGVNMVVVDESTMIKNPTAKRTIRVHNLSNLATYKRILTGTPIDQSPLDLYSQFYFLHPGIFYGWSYWAFRSQFAVMEDYTRPDGKTIKIVVGYKKLDELAEIIAPWSYRVTKDECLDLPAKIYETREITLNPRTKKLYRELESGVQKLIKDGVSLSTPMAITRIMKLRQICGGAVINTDNSVTEFDDSKIRECLTIIEDSSHGVIIWCQFKHEILRIIDRLMDKDIEVHEISGRVKSIDRDVAIKKFNSGNSVIVCQNDSGQMGITLNGASTAIFYSNSYKYGNREQAEDRCHRIGQTKHVTYFDLIVKGTVDEDVLGAIHRKEDLATTILRRIG